MSRHLVYDVHPANPQGRLLQSVAQQIRGGAIAAVPTAAGYGLVCRLDDKAATDRLRRCADAGQRTPPALLCRDVAQAASYLQVGDQAFRTIRAAGDGSQAFLLRSTRRVPRRLASAANGASLLHFGGHAAAQGLLGMLDEPLLLALPPGALARVVDDVPLAWLGVLDVALDVGPLDARPVHMVDLLGILQQRPSLSRWLGVEAALA